MLCSVIVVTWDLGDEWVRLVVSVLDGVDSKRSDLSKFLLEDANIDLK